MRINLRPGATADADADRLQRSVESGVDEACVDAFALFPRLDQLHDFAGRAISSSP
ncbi:hypothetical protein [Catenuloplanes japonicus]|uniref:hypothetical protein n=1 Tax=Catenuloplanes japonicus TaxID=33876 RepID=UPI000AD41552|nr:hypothetical protein [Catenuloplanes japonicus]